MLTCKEVTELASKAQDMKLTFGQRMQLKMHLMMCKLCSRYVKQLAFLRTAVQDLDAHEHHAQLSAEAKNRIRQSLEKQSKN